MDVEGIVLTSGDREIVHNSHNSPNATQCKCKVAIFEGIAPKLIEVCLTELELKGCRFQVSSF